MVRGQKQDLRSLIIGDLGYLRLAAYLHTYVSTNLPDIGDRLSAFGGGEETPQKFYLKMTARL